MPLPFCLSLSTNFLVPSSIRPHPKSDTHNTSAVSYSGSVGLISVKMP